MPGAGSFLLGRYDAAAAAGGSKPARSPSSADPGLVILLVPGCRRCQVLAAGYCTLCVQLSANQCCLQNAGQASSMKGVCTAMQVVPLPDGQLSCVAQWGLHINACGSWMSIQCSIWKTIQIGSSGTAHEGLRAFEPPATWFSPGILRAILLPGRSSDHYTDCLMEALQSALGRAQWPGAQDEAGTGKAFVGDGKPSPGHQAAAHDRNDAGLTAARPSSLSETPGPAEGKTGTHVRQQGSSTEHGRGHDADVQHNFGGNAPRDAGSFRENDHRPENPELVERAGKPAHTSGPAGGQSAAGARQQGASSRHGQSRDADTAHQPGGNAARETYQLREDPGSNPECRTRPPLSSAPGLSED